MANRKLRNCGIFSLRLVPGSANLTGNRTGGRVWLAESVANIIFGEAEFISGGYHFRRTENDASRPLMCTTIAKMCVNLDGLDRCRSLISSIGPIKM